MPGVCVIGLQWGDEAKGKLVDLLTEGKEIVVRYLGGANAGHTVVVGDQTYKLHQIPSGVLNPGVMNIITAGVVLHPGTLLQELESLRSRGIDVEDRLMISDRAHLVLPWHVAEDRLWNEEADADAKGDVKEDARQDESIGTTMRGIGPCYRDKVGRKLALRVGDLVRDDFDERVRRVARSKIPILEATNQNRERPLELDLDVNQIVQQYTEYAKQIGHLVGDTNAFLLDAVDENRSLLFEGAQGALLDVDHGTFPYVTSSNSSGVGICAGAGVPNKAIDEVIGVAKSYSTRVGGGPFPTEQDNDYGDHLRRRGNEYGTTTGRPRRCGWFDAVAVRYTARLSGVDRLALMMLDVLSELNEIQICVAYELDGRETDRFPSHVDDLRQVRPVYERMPGWETDITHARSMDDLPQAAIDYVTRISELVGRPVEFISVGPDREQTITGTRLASSTPC